MRTSHSVKSGISCLCFKLLFVENHKNATTELARKTRHHINTTLFKTKR